MIHFPRADFWVAPGSVGKYARWACKGHVESGGVVRGLGQYLWLPSRTKRIPWEVSNLLERAIRLGVRPAWLRGHSDGTRSQVFDGRGDRLAQLALGREGRRAMRRELWARRRAGSLAPRILARASDGSGYVEEIAVGRKTRCSPELLQRIVEQLQARFYKPRQISFERYTQLLRRWGPLEPLEEEALKAAARILGDQHVLVSWVHGDLWPGNVLDNAQGKYVLLDWEYTRPCVVTADAWFYLYHAYRLQRNDRAGFFAALSVVLRRRWGIEGEETLLAWHLLHLAERRQFLRSVGGPLPGHAATRTEKDMRSALASGNFR